MSSVDGQSALGGSPSSEPADLKLEAVVIPVADVDRSKAFYAGLGWRLDAYRLPGRLDPTTTSFNSAGDLAAALQRAASAHGEHEKRIGRADPDWPDWYAEYIVSEQSGQELPG